MNKSEFPVLLIEDDPDDVLLIRRVFLKAEIQRPLIVAATAEEAENYVLGNGPHVGRILPALILLDLHLPGRSGCEMLAWLREQQSLRAVPVVVLSGSEDPAQVNRAYQLGANSFVSKNQLTTGVLADRMKGLLKYWLESNVGDREER